MNSNIDVELRVYYKLDYKNYNLLNSFLKVPTENIKEGYIKKLKHYNDFDNDSFEIYSIDSNSINKLDGYVEIDLKKQNGNKVISFFFNIDGNNIFSIVTAYSYIVGNEKIDQCISFIKNITRTSSSKSYSTNILFTTSFIAMEDMCCKCFNIYSIDHLRENTCVNCLMEHIISSQEGGNTIEEICI